MHIKNQTSLLVLALKLKDLLFFADRLGIFAAED